jgi:hypothetical protein
MPRFAMDCSACRSRRSRGGGGGEDYYVQATKSTGFNIFEILNGTVQRAKPSTIQMVSELTSIVHEPHNCDGGCTGSAGTSTPP